MQILSLFLRFVISRSENVFGENLKKHYFFHIKHCQIHNFEARTTRFCAEVILHVPILPIKFQRSSSTESVETNVLKKCINFLRNWLPPSFLTLTTYWRQKTRFIHVRKSGMLPLHHMSWASHHGHDIYGSKGQRKKNNTPSQIFYHRISLHLALFLHFYFIFRPSNRVFF